MKNPKNNTNKFSALFFQIGLTTAILMVLLAFEWKFKDSGATVSQNAISTDFDELLDIPVTIQPPPPPTKIQQPTIVEMPDEEEIEEEIEIEFDVEIDEEEVIDEMEIVEEVVVEEEVTDEIFAVVEQLASYRGGPESMIRDIASRLKYPENARRRAVEGRVFVSFVVEKDGELTDVRIVKGIGAGCDEEAVRIIRNLPNWNPAKQRGQAVRSRVTIPLTFRLN